MYLSVIGTQVLTFRIGLDSFSLFFNKCYYCGTKFQNESMAGKFCDGPFRIATTATGHGVRPVRPFLMLNVDDPYQTDQMVRIQIWYILSCY